jgi:hypothetical protein
LFNPEAETVSVFTATSAPRFAVYRAAISAARRSTVSLSRTHIVLGKLAEQGQADLVEPQRRVCQIVSRWANGRCADIEC